MANTLTNLMPDLYESLDVVSRELVGFIPAVTLDANIARAAVGENVRSFYTSAVSPEDATPGQLPPDDGDQIVGNVPIQITKSRIVPFRWTGDDQRGVNFGPGYAAIRQDQIRQAMRGLCNEIEVFIANLAIAGASRAYGTPGTTPFASDLSAASAVRKILDDNGAPPGDRHLVLNTTAGMSMRNLTQLTKANEAGSADFRKQGNLAEAGVFAFEVRESAGVQLHTAGTGSAYVTNGSTAQGATTVAVQTGSGTILAGDFITFAGDTDKYVVGSALSAGSLGINRPGIVPAAGIATSTAVTVGATYTGNAAFSRNAIALATRAPAIPEEGDMADDSVIIQDPRSGLAFEVRMYRQYRRIRYEIGIAYGGAVVKPEHLATLLG